MERVIRHDGMALAPCPHCAARPQIVQRDTQYLLRCPVEDCEIQTELRATEGEAIAEWESLSAEWNPYT